MSNNGLLTISSEGELYLRELNLDTYKDSLQQSSSLIKYLDLRNNSLISIPLYICELKALLSLDLRENTIELIPEELSALPWIQTLKLDYNHLSLLPLSLYNLFSLKSLTVSHNHLSSLDKEISGLKGLTILDVSYNQIKVIPGQIGKLRNLKSLFLQGNEFSVLPAVLHNLTDLQHFSLEWLRYTSPTLPISLKGATGDVLIRSLQSLSSLYNNTKKCEINLISFLKHFTELPFALERSGPTGISLLHKSVLNNDIGVLKGLIESGCDVNYLDTDGYSPLVLSIRESHSQISKILLNAECNVNIGGGAYGSALHLAIAKNENWLVASLLKANCRVDLKSNDGNTIMHVLMVNFKKHKHRSQAIGELILAAGAETNACNNDNWAPIHIAARKAQNSAIKWVALVNSSKAFKHCKFDINVSGGKQEWRALHLSAHTGLFKTTKLLIRAGGDIFCKNKMGKTPKDIAKGNLALFKYLTKLEKEYLKEVVKENKEWVFEESEEKDLYGQVYAKFRERDVEGIKKVMETTGEAEEKEILQVDAVYLIGRIMEKQPKEYLKKIAKEDKGALVKQETISALRNIKIFESSIISPRYIIGPRVSATSQVSKIRRNDSEVPDELG